MSILSGASRPTRATQHGLHLLKGFMAALAAGLVTFYTHGLTATDVVSAMEELWAGAIMTRTRRPLYAVHVDPIFDSAAAIATFWKHFHIVFPDLALARYFGVGHMSGPTRGDHEHRVYDITSEDGKVADLSFDIPRRGKVSVLTAHELGWPVPPIAHPKAVAAALRKEGNDLVADWLMADPRAQGPRRVAKMTPAERQQAERTKVDPTAVAASALAAWERARDGPSFMQGLIRAGLIPAVGNKKIVVVDHGGGAHDIVRAVKKSAKAAGRALDATALTQAVAGWTLLPQAKNVQRERTKNGSEIPTPAIDAPAVVARGKIHRRWPDAVDEGDRGKQPRDPRSRAGNPETLEAAGGRLGRGDDSLGRTDGDRNVSPGEQRVGGSVDGDREQARGGFRGAGPSPGERAAARLRAVLLMVDKTPPSPEVIEASKKADFAALQVRRATERLLARIAEAKRVAAQTEKARLAAEEHEAVQRHAALKEAVKQEAADTIDHLLIAEENIVKKLEEIRLRKPAPMPGSTKEKINNRVGKATSAFIRGNKALNAATAARDKLLPIPSPAGYFLRMFTHIPGVRSWAQQAVAQRESRHRFVTKAMAAAEGLVVKATANVAMLNIKRQRADEFEVRLQKRHAKREENIRLQQQRQVLKDLKKTRGFRYLLEWKPDYINRPQIEVEKAIRDQVWQAAVSTEGDGTNTTSVATLSTTRK